MNHETYKIQISSYIDKELNQSETQNLLDHLKDCCECQDFYKESVKLSKLVSKWPEEALSNDIESSVTKSLSDSLKRKEESMKNNTLRNFTLAGGLIIAVIAVTISIQTYSQRALQARVRDAGKFMSTQTQMLASTISPIQGRLKSATDDIGDQFSIGRTKQSISSRAPATREIAMLGAKLQYEPYYQTTSYSLDRDSGAPSMDRQTYSESMAVSLPIMESEKFNTENYNRIYENKFLEAKDNPLSTFSIDVDTASYSNIRRFLNNNQMPPEDAVRIEEMVNYFSYNYPKPKNNDPFSITMKMAVCPWNKKHYLGLIGLQGKTLDQGKLSPSNLVFLIDVSGSMNQPNKLPLLKQSLSLMVNQLTSNEHVAIVVYAGAAGKVLDSTPGDQKQTILNAINQLQASGSTAGGAGIKLAYKIAKENFIKNGNNRVILATDGDFNVGVSSDGELTRLIEEKRKEGVFLTVLGFGMGNYKDNKMEQIADKGNGNYYYIDTINEGRKVLGTELGSTLFTIAKDVKIQVEFNPSEVKAYRLVGYENRMLAKEDFNDDTKDAGELGAGHTVTALYEIIPAGSEESVNSVDPLKYQQVQTVNSSEVMTLKFRYKEINEETSKLLMQVVAKEDIKEEPTDDFKFASSVAEFGLLLRNSEFKGESNYAQVIKNAQESIGKDSFGYRQEFINLVNKAVSFDTRSTSQGINFKSHE